MNLVDELKEIEKEKERIKKEKEELEKEYQKEIDKITYQNLYKKNIIEKILFIFENINQLEHITKLPRKKFTLAKTRWEHFVDKLNFRFTQDYPYRLDFGRFRIERVDFDFLKMSFYGINLLKFNFKEKVIINADLSLVEWWLPIFENQYYYLENQLEEITGKERVRLEQELNELEMMKKE